MSATGPLDPRYLDDLRTVAKGLGYNLVRREECLEIGARGVISNEMQSLGASSIDLMDMARSQIARRIGSEIVRNFDLTLLPKTGDASVFELRLTILKPRVAEPDTDRPDDGA